jgi:hypothetical protein
MNKINVKKVFTSSPLSGPRLLVPIAVEALPVDKNGNSVKYAALTPQYNSIEEEEVVLGDLIVKGPFSTGQNLEQGVHLHWALPDALTHGSQDSTGNMDYPCVPNRWFVQRMYTSTGSDSKPVITIKAWLIESDFITHKQTIYNANSVTIPTLNSAVSKFMYLGRQSEYEVGGLPEGLYLEKLTAVGPGDPVFAAYYPNCRSVFGFYDPLADISRGMLSYMVAGWYSRAEQDPLYGQTADTWKSRMAELQWSVSDSSNLCPTLTLCHGMICGIDWQGPNGKYPSGCPNGAIDIAVGNSSVEALSALLAAKLPNDKNVERLLEAFQFDLLSKWDSPDGIMQLEEKLHENMFGTSDGGSCWEIRRVQDAPHDTAENPGQAFPAGIGIKLGKLNHLQSQYNILTRRLASRQWELYSMWYKFVSAEEDPFSGGGDAGRIEIKIHDFINRIGTLKQQVADIGIQMDQSATKLKSDITNNLPLYALEKTPAPRFFQPNAPVVLFAGEGIRKSYKHGEDGRFSEDGTLFCRVTGQTVSFLSLAVAEKQIQVTGSDLLALCGKIPSGTPIPAEIQDLFVETLFLDTNQASSIAWAAFRLAGVSQPTGQQLDDLAATITKLQNLPLNAALYRELSSQALAVSAGFNGVMPSKVSINPWSAPWTPLYLEWFVNMLPAKTMDKPDNSIDPWTLGDIDYCWKNSSPPEKAATRFQSCVLITPHASANLKAALEKYIQTHQPDDELRSELQDMAGQFGNLTILSQAISGFNEDLLMQKQTLQFPIFDNEDGNPDLALQVAKWVEDHNALSPEIGAKFNPIRAGFLQIMDLWLVDSFGQVQEISKISPIIAEAMRTPGNPFNGLITLPPRITQASRLNFKWLAAEDDTLETNADPATSPVCGWVLPNHLDRSLMVYDSGGNMLGSLQTVERKDGSSNVIWLSTPGSDMSPGAVPDIGNPQLNAFVAELVNYGKSGVPALTELLENMDEALQNIEPRGINPHLAVLIGRPLALVRASLELELDGLPAYHQGWKYIDGAETNGFTEVPFTVRLGDMRKLGDGLVGFFIDNGDRTYKTFHPTNGMPKLENGSAYIDDRDQVKLQANPDVPPQKLTLLLDPGAAVHATSGILPVTSLELSPDYIASALAAINVTFRVNPLINASVPVSLPIPGGIKGDWAWICHPDTMTWQEENSPGNTSQNALLSSRPQQVMEGWLRLSNVNANNAKTGKK